MFEMCVDGQDQSMNIDRNLGRHAAANLSDAELRHILGVAAFEMAVRLSAEDYRELVHAILVAPENAADVLDEVREERESIAFAEAVLLDIASLPEVT